VKKYVDRGASEDLSAAGPEIRARLSKGDRPIGSNHAGRRSATRGGRTIIGGDTALAIARRAIASTSSSGNTGKSVLAGAASVASATIVFNTGSRRSQRATL
jgi:hypothetical protein